MTNGVVVPAHQAGNQFLGSFKRFTDTGSALSGSFLCWKIWENGNCLLLFLTEKEAIFNLALKKISFMKRVVCCGCFSLLSSELLRKWNVEKMSNKANAAMQAVNVFPVNDLKVTRKILWSWRVQDGDLSVLGVMWRSRCSQELLNPETDLVT